MHFPGIIMWEKKNAPINLDQGGFSCGGNGWVSPIPATNLLDLSQ